MPAKRGQRAPPALAQPASRWPAPAATAAAAAPAAGPRSLALQRRPLTHSPLAVSTMVASAPAQQQRRRRHGLASPQRCPRRWCRRRTRPWPPLLRHLPLLHCLTGMAWVRHRGVRPADSTRQQPLKQATRARETDARVVAQGCAALHSQGLQRVASKGAATRPPRRPRVHAPSMACERASQPQERAAVTAAVSAGRLAFGRVVAVGGLAFSACSEAADEA